LDSKRLDAALTMAKLMQEQLPPRKRSNNKSRHRDQATLLFSISEPADEPFVKRRRASSVTPRFLDTFHPNFDYRRRR
jgi:hypothetical protein